MALTTVPNSMQQTPFRKNLIINGGMTISQRAALFTSVVNAEYTLDRWQLAKSGAMVFNVSQQTDTATPELTSSYMFVEVTTADASVESTDVVVIQQKIEGYNIIPIGWQLADQSKKNDVTVSFWHSYTKTGTHCVALRNAGNSRSYVHEFTQAVANTWEYTSFTVPAPTDGTWAVDNTTSLKLVFAAVAGSSFHTTADVWQTGNFITTSNQVNNMDSTSNRMRITGVQLEVGTEATDFEYRNYGEELMLCYRYTEVITLTGVADFLLTAQAFSASQAFGTLQYSEKRAVPTITNTGSFVTTTAGAATNAGTPTWVPQNTKHSRLDITGGTGMVAGDATCILAGTAPTPIIIDAEL